MGKWTPRYNRTKHAASKLYFAYGSNTNISQMSFRCKDAEPVNSVLIKNWELVFRGVADIERKEGAELLGGIWKISEYDEEELDIYEGVRGGLYSKQYFRFKGEPLFFYKMNSRRIAAPSDYYYKTIEDGYKDFGLDLDPLEAARDIAIEKTSWLDEYDRYSNYGYYK